MVAPAATAPSCVARLDGEAGAAAGAVKPRSTGRAGTAGEIKRMYDRAAARRAG